MGGAPERAPPPWKTDDTPSSSQRSAADGSSRAPPYGRRPAPSDDDDPWADLEREEAGEPWEPPSSTKIRVNDTSFLNQDPYKQNLFTDFTEEDN